MSFKYKRAGEREREREGEGNDKRKDCSIKSDDQSVMGNAMGRQRVNAWLILNNLGVWAIFSIPGHRL